MELWLDTINFEVIKNASKMMHITGVTTNPSILSKSGDLPENTIRKLLDIQPGFLAVQVTSTTEKSMLDQARKLYNLSSRIIIKVPVFNVGLSVIRTLHQENIATMATAIFEPIQIYLSILSGAQYAAPYLGRIEKNTGEYSRVIAEMLTVIKNHNSQLKLLTASISSKKQIMDCALLAAHAITLPLKAYEDFVSNNPETMQCIEDFKNDWSSSKAVIDSEIFC